MVVHDYKYVLVYQNNLNYAETLSRLFKDENEIADNIDWISEQSKKQWFILNPRDDLVSSKGVIEAVHEKLIRDDEAQLRELQTKQTFGMVEINRLEQSLDGHR